MTPPFQWPAGNAIRVAMVASSDPQDQAILHQLRKHLRILERARILAAWNAVLDPDDGDARGIRFEMRLLGADIALVLVSPTLLSDPTPVNVLDLLEDMSTKGLRVVPVLARATALVFHTMGVRDNLTKVGHWLEAYAELPRSGVYLSDCRDLDSELMLITREVRSIADRMTSSRAETS